jgi:hypothetical protein
MFILPGKSLHRQRQLAPWNLPISFELRRGSFREESSMRSSITAALTASAVLAMTSIVSAQTTQQSSDTSNAAANRANNPDYGMTAAQEDAIPYHACSNAVGWVNGRLVCRNN